MYKKILVAADASENSRHAFASAVECAKLLNAEILVIHVFSQERPVLRAGSENFVGTYSKEEINLFGKEVLDATMRGTDTGGIHIERKVVVGYPAAKIVEEVKNDSSIDLIVMGTRGHNPFTGAILGSVAQRVLANAPCPVLVVK